MILPSRKKRTHKSTTPEGRVKAEVISILKSVNAWYMIAAAGAIGGTIGIPDIIACYKGTFIAIECKSAVGVLTGLQSHQLLQIFAAGGITMVISPDNITDLYTVLERIDTTK